MFAEPGALQYGPVRQVPIPQVQDREGEQVTETMREMVDAVSRRIPWDQLLEDKRLLEHVILASGGHLRDLFMILQEVIILVSGQGLELPVGRAHVDEALAAVARGFSKITREPAELMRRIHEKRGEIEPSAGEVALLTGLMHTHMLLNHQNGDDWYEVHPLARRTLGLE